MPNYYQPEIETMPYEQLRQLQNEKLLKQVRHVWDNVLHLPCKLTDILSQSLLRPLPSATVKMEVSRRLTPYRPRIIF